LAYCKAYSIKIDDNKNDDSEEEESEEEAEEATTIDDLEISIAEEDTRMSLTTYLSPNKREAH
jgi:hypothetical protein